MGYVKSPCLCIVTEYLPTNMQYVLSSNAVFDWGFVIHFSLEISKGIRSLHEYNPPIIHRDIKPSNFLVLFCMNLTFNFRAIISGGH